MAFTQKDIKQTLEFLGLDPLWMRITIEDVANSFRRHDTPCNCCFIRFRSYGEWSKSNAEVLFAAARHSAREDCAPTFGLSVTEKEPAYKAIMEHIKGSPRFQTITTGSRHGRYKVVWVIGRADGRAFPQPKTQRPVTKESLRTGKK